MVLCIMPQPKEAAFSLFDFRTVCVASRFIKDSTLRKTCLCRTGFSTDFCISRKNVAQFTQHNTGTFQMGFVSTLDHAKTVLH